MRSRNLKRGSLAAASLIIIFLLRLRHDQQSYQTTKVLQISPEALIQLDSRNFVNARLPSPLGVTDYVQSSKPLHYTERQTLPQVVPASPEEVEKARCKGQKLLDAIANPSTTASIWTEEAEMDDYGWVKQTGKQAASEFDAIAGSLGQSNVPGFGDPSWTTITWTMNGAEYEGTWYPACNAYYTNNFNPAHGTILAINNDGPAHVDPPQDPLVPLRQLSDVLFLTWQHLCEVQGVSTDHIDRIIRINIINDDTLELMLAVLKSERGIALMTDLGDFDNRQEFLPTDAGFDVLLATPNGNGIAWFLAQHRKELGAKKIKRITLWDNQSLSQREQFGTSLCMMFEFE